MTLMGLDDALAVFEALQFQFDGDAVYVVGPTVEYAVYHELGTSKMEARPFAAPAAERVEANLEAHIGRFLDTPTPDERAVVHAAALAVEREMKRIVEEKDIWDTGTLHGSIGVERVQ
jgi:hypothetical protein